MKRGNNKTESSPFISAARESIKLIDRKKFESYEQNHQKGIKNFILFQKFSSFRWPLWLQSRLNVHSPFFQPVSPFSLLNHTNRNWITVSNFLSAEQVMIDPSGMITPSYGDWSLELWLYRDGEIHRPQDRSGMITQSRDPETSIVTTHWKEDDWSLVVDVFGARSSIDEVIVEAACTMKRSAESAMLILAVRPYTIVQLGGIKSAEYRPADQAIAINKIDRIICETRADQFITGNGHEGDCDFRLREKQAPSRTTCEFGMASLALGFQLGKGERCFRFRIGLAENKAIVPAKIKFAEIKKDFTAFVKDRCATGCTFTTPDPVLGNWFKSSKTSVLQSIGEVYRSIRGYASGDSVDSIFYVCYAFHRLGYFKESLRLIDSFLEQYRVNEKLTFEELMSGCYLVSICADYFIISRDTEFLQGRYAKIRDIANAIFTTSSAGAFQREVLAVQNSIPGCYLSQGHRFDQILIAFALQQFSYLSRCMGLFGEEIRFAGQSQAMQSRLLLEIFGIEPGADEKKPGKTKKKKKSGTAVQDIAPADDYSIYHAFMGAPFRLSVMNAQIQKQMTDQMFEYYRDFPLSLKSSGGWNSFLSLILALNALHSGDRRFYDILDTILETASRRYAVAEIMHPATGVGVSGTGDSRNVLALIIVLMRNSLFIDHENRLEIAPGAKDEWYQPGSEMAVVNAPSRFGLIDFRLVATQNEVVVYFQSTPAFLPPEVLIHIPFKTRIVESDEFLVKKEIGSSYLISGWPSVVRFIRK